MRLANGETESEGSDKGEITRFDDGTIEYQLSDDEILPLNDAGQTLYPFTIRESFSMEDFELRIKVDHTYLGDLAVSLAHPSGREILLRSNRHFIYRILDTTYTFENGESYELEDLKEMEAKGEWTLQFKDLFPGDVGTLKYVYLKISGR